MPISYKKSPLPRLGGMYWIGMLTSGCYFIWIPTSLEQSGYSTHFCIQMPFLLTRPITPTTLAV